MNRSIPQTVEDLIAEEVAHHPGMTSREFILDAIRQHLRRTKGNRERGERQRAGYTMDS